MKMYISIPKKIYKPYSSFLALEMIWAYTFFIDLREFNNKKTYRLQKCNI